MQPRHKAAVAAKGTDHPPAAGDDLAPHLRRLPRSSGDPRFPEPEFAQPVHAPREGSNVVHRVTVDQIHCNPPYNF